MSLDMFSAFVLLSSLIRFSREVLISLYLREKPEPRVVEDTETANDVIDMFSQKTGQYIKRLYLIHNRKISKL